MKKIIYYLTFFLMILLYFLAKYRFSYVSQFNNMLEVSFIKSNINEEYLENILEENKDINSIVGVSENGFVDVIEESYKRRYKAKNLKVFGDINKLFHKQNILYKSYFEENGVYISDSLSYNLFKSNNVLGKTINIENKEYFICGIFEDKSSIVITKSNKENLFDNIKVFFSSNNVDANIEKFIRVNNFNDCYINKHNIKIDLIYLLFEIYKIVLILLFTYSFLKALNLRKIYFKILYIIFILVEFLIFKINIKIPISFIPNKWSDFIFYKNIFNDIIKNNNNFKEINSMLLLENNYFIISLTLILSLIGVIILWYKQKK